MGHGAAIPSYYQVVGVAQVAVADEKRVACGPVETVVWVLPAVAIVGVEGVSSCVGQRGEEIVGVVGVAGVEGGGDYYVKEDAGVHVMVAA